MPTYQIDTGSPSRNYPKNLITLIARDNLTSDSLVVGQGHPGINDGIRIQRQTFDPFIDQPLREIGMVGGSLTADADVLVRLAAGLDRQTTSP